MTLSPQIRVIAIVGLVAALGLGASMLLLGRSSSSTQTEAQTTPAATTAPAVTQPPAATPAARKPHVAPAPAKPQPTTKTHAPATTHHVAKKRSNLFHGNPVYANLPAPLQWQLAHHKVVVVSIYNPHSDTDAISVAEAHQGAVDAKVGFLLVDVLDNKVAGLLTGLLPGGGLLPDPGVLVYRAPGDIALRIDGFADRDAVEQAALNVRDGESGPVTATTTTAASTAVPPVATPAPSTATTP